MSELKEAALFYARVGYHVFPCVPGTKRPAVEGGFKSATRDEATIGRWWDDMPAANIGIAAAGLMLIDVDPGGEFPLAQGDGTPIQRTPRGGRHMLFRRPAGRAWRNSQGKLAPKVDTRTDGGYFLVSPSVTADGSYEWLTDPVSVGELPEPPPWLCESLDSIVREATPPAPSVASSEYHGDVEARAIAYLGAMPPAISGAKGHNITFDAARAMVYGFDLGQERGFALLWSHYNPNCVPPWSEKELRHKCRQADSVEFDKPRGWLLDNAGYRTQEVNHGIDLTGILNQMSASKAEPAPRVVEAPQEADEPSPASDDPGPIPASLMRCPGFVNEYIDHCLKTAHAPNVALAFCGALSLLSLLTGRKVRDSTNTRTNIYLLALAGSSSGKNRPREINAEILHEIGLSKQLASGFASAEGLQDSLFSTPAMLAQIDEMDSLLQSINSKDVRHEQILKSLLEFYSSSSSVFTMRKKAGKSNPEAIVQPHLVLFGTAIPEHFYSALSLRMLTNGLLGRTLIVESGPKGKSEEPDFATVPERLTKTAAFWRDFSAGGNLSQEHPSPVVVQATPEAKAELSRVLNECDQRYAKAESLRDTPATTIWGRATAHVRKLSLLAACSENHKQPVISVLHVQWADELVLRQAKRMLFMASDHVSDGDFGSLCLKCVRVLREAKGWKLSRSEILRKVIQDAQVLDRVISSLDQQGRLKIEVMPSTGGRPKTNYTLLT